MKFRIVEQDAAVGIDIEAPAGKQPRVLKSLQACAEGHCTCPTPEYAKLESMQVEQAPQGIQVTLKTKPGQTLERSAIERCVQHTLDEAGEPKPE
jgi:hypothetical protein